MDADTRAATAAHWHEWLGAEMAKAGMRQVDLVKASNGRLLPAAVSKWTRGEFTASAENAITVAQILGADPIAALLAAGHYEIANIAKGAPSDATAQDPTIARIEADPNLSPRERQFLIAAYRSDLEQARQRAVQTAELVAGARTAK